jgi:hypothetical protein
MSAGTLPVEGLEEIYEEMAHAIDAVGERNEVVFLTKLALLLADAVGDPSRVRQAIADAQSGVVEPLSH